jgi:hypothetical protein
MSAVSDINELQVWRIAELKKNILGHGHCTVPRLRVRIPIDYEYADRIGSPIAERELPCYRGLISAPRRKKEDGGSEENSHGHGFTK